MPFDADYRPSRQHAELGPALFDEVRPADFPAAILRFRNRRWAERVGLAGLTDDEWLRFLGRLEPLPGSFEAPLALRYHGHQFRSYNPDLGDGRGFLHAQLREVGKDGDGRLLDLGTKGSGRTPWSRGGDGRLTLKGGVREVLATELLEALGVYTSKSFSLVETGEQLQRGDEPTPTRSAVLVRLSHGHVRVGTFQRLAYLGDGENLLRLLDYSVRTYQPAAWRDDAGERAVAFLEAVTGDVARMGAQWMAAGFVHGVLNTDNINITGESFDYGPWRFLPHYDPGFTAAYFDSSGLYSYGRQPDTLLWNLTRLAECLLPFATKEQLGPVLAGFAPAFHTAIDAGVLRRLGLGSLGPEEDHATAQAWWEFLAETRVPFEQAFFDWHGGRPSDRLPRSPTDYGSAFDPARTALARHPQAARADHPYFAGTPCTLLIDEVEALWAPIAESDDWSAFDAKLRHIARAREAYGIS